MVKSKFIAGIILAACVLFVVPSAASAEEDTFAKVGHAIEIESGGINLIASGAEVDCETVSGKGTVASAKQIKMTAILSACTMSLGEETLKATVTNCELSLSPEGTLTLEGGCRVEAAGCTVEPSTTENKQLKEAAYVNRKEVEEGEISYASEVVLGAGGMTYTAKGATCELAGVKSGKEGEVRSEGAIEAKGAEALPVRKFSVKQDSPAASRKIKLESTTAQVFSAFGPFSKPVSIKCAEMKLAGTVASTVTTTDTLKFNTIAFNNCVTDILGTANEAVGVAIASGCEMGLSATEGTTVSPKRGLFGTPTRDCIEFKVKTCVIFVPVWANSSGYVTLCKCDGSAKNGKNGNVRIGAAELRVNPATFLV
jgi:hypothetical protein